jgi:ribosomal protein S18 acetylase RimI-like enzyme
MLNNIMIRRAKEQDFASIWKIFKKIIAKGDTYVNRPQTTKSEAYSKWMDKTAKTFVAIIDKKVVGAYLIRDNRVDFGSHIANCSYIVDEECRGLGIGKALGAHSIQTAHKLKYQAMQFNFVVSTNKPAINLWQSLGFRIIGTVPKGFNHLQLGLVDAHIMFREL